MSRPEIVTFDCYGTLIDWNGGIVGAFAGEGRRQGRQVDDAIVLAAYHVAEPRAQQSGFSTYREVLARLEAEVAAELGWDPPAEPGYLAESLPDWMPFSETNRALRRLADSGLALGILSNIDNDLLEGTLRHLEVEFELLVTAEQVRSYKPAPTHFERALEHVDGKRERLLHVAQSYFHDVRPARSLDITTVWVNRLAEKLPPDGPSPSAMVADLAEAAAWVERLRDAGQGR